MATKSVDRYIRDIQIPDDPSTSARDPSSPGRADPADKSRPRSNN